MSFKLFDFANHVQNVNKNQMEFEFGCILKIEIQHLHDVARPIYFKNHTSWKSRIIQYRTHVSKPCLHHAAIAAANEEASC